MGGYIGVGGFLGPKQPKVYAPGERTPAIEPDPASHTADDTGHSVDTDTLKADAA